MARGSVAVYSQWLFGESPQLRHQAGGLLGGSEGHVGVVQF